MARLRRISACAATPLAAARAIMDASLSPAEEAAIGSIIMGTPGVMGYHHLRTRKAGEKTVLDFHLELDKDMALQDAHAISEEVEQSLHHHCGPCDPTIHVLLFWPTLQSACSCLYAAAGIPGNFGSPVSILLY